MRARHSAATTRSSSAWRPASARPTACSRRARPSRGRARRRRSATSRPTAGRDTTRRPSDLEVVPRRRVRYREIELDEMDLPAVLARRPELALVDELAHTNAPGIEHRKRFEDVEDILGAGIDVLSTVNVQHLESLNDQVAELTGVTRARDAARRRARAAPTRSSSSTSRPRRSSRACGGQDLPARPRRRRAERLLQDREPRGAARDRAAPGRRGGRGQAPRPRRRRTREDRLFQTAAAPQAVAERLLALVEPYPASQRLVRRAWRSAQRLGAELDLLWVAPPEREPTPRQREQLDALRRLASVLGAHLLVEHGDLVEAVRARRRGPRHDLRADGRAVAAARPAPAWRSASDPAHRRAARRRRADRRRPISPRGPTAMTDIAAAAFAALCAGLLAWRALDALRARSRRRHAAGAAASCSRSPAVRSRSRCSTRRFASPAPRTRRSSRPTSRGCRCTSRSTPRCRGSAARPCRCSRRSSTARRAGASPSTRASSAGAPTATRCACCSRTSAQDRVIVAADTAGTDGFDAADIAWLLEHAAGEILVLRPAHDHLIRAAADRTPPAVAAEAVVARRNAPEARAARWCSPDMLARRATR